MNRAASLATLVVSGSTIACLAAQQSSALGIEKIRDNLFVLTGNGGNTAVFIRADGVVVVDTKLANNGQRILEQVKTVTDKPITHILNTHTHADHVGSNDFCPEHVVIVAHNNTAARMARMSAFSDSATRHGLPTRTFTDKMTLFSGDEAIDLYYFGAAHTDGDAFIVFRAQRVMHSGDTFPGMFVTDDGGRRDTYAKTLMDAATGIAGVDTVIPGHGAVATWQAFVDYVDSMQQ